MNDPYTTSDTPFAAFLCYHQHVVVKTMPDKNDRKRIVFVFIKNPDTEILEEQYYKGNPDVDARIFYKKLREVQRKLNEAR